MTTLAEEATKAGRPINIYKTHPAAFERFWTTTPRAEKPLLDENGFGTVGYCVDKQNRHLFRIQLIPTSPSNKFFWARVQTPKPDVEWAFPGAFAREDIKRLLDVWEAYEAVWTEGPVACPFFPDDWKVPGAFAQSPKRFMALSFDPTALTMSLQQRPGIHTMRTSTSKLAGIVADSEDIESLRPFFVKESKDGKLVPFPRVGAKLTDSVISRLRELGANYVRRLLLTAPEEGVNPFIPHAHVINLPLASVSRFEP